MIHRDEKVWVAFVGAMMAAFLASLAYAAWALGLQVPYRVQLVPPQKATELLQPGVREVAPGIYEVTLVGRMWVWLPNNISLVNPREVKFRLVSPDVIHGFEVAGTNVNVMVFPGYVAEITWQVPPSARGTYLIVCNEYCGTGHPYMYGYLNIVRK